MPKRINDPIRRAMRRAYIGQRCHAIGCGMGTAVISLLLVGIAAAQVPLEFRGVWAGSGLNKQCTAADWEHRAHEFDLINITDRTWLETEMNCDVREFRIRKIPAPALVPSGVAEVALACRGDGYTWRTREYWSVREVEGRKALIVVSRERTNVRGQGGRYPIEGTQPLITLYLQCK
jgi:hypothetical protein